MLAGANLLKRNKLPLGTEINSYLTKCARSCDCLYFFSLSVPLSLFSYVSIPHDEFALGSVFISAARSRWRRRRWRAFAHAVRFLNNYNEGNYLVRRQAECDESLLHIAARKMIARSGWKKSEGGVKEAEGGG